MPLQGQKNLPIDRRLHHQLKVAAVVRGESMKVIVEGLIAKWLEKEKAGADTQHP